MSGPRQPVLRHDHHDDDHDNDHHVAEPWHNDRAIPDELQRQLQDGVVGIGENLVPGDQQLRKSCHDHHDGHQQHVNQHDNDHHDADPALHVRLGIRRVELGGCDEHLHGGNVRVRHRQGLFAV